MNKYVDKKHGMIIGSGHYFITHDEHAPVGVPHLRADYRAIVWQKMYNFDQINMLNIQVKTPVEQLLWIEREELVNKKYDDFEYHDIKQYYILRDWWKQWLEKNVGPIYDKWDVKSRITNRTDTSVMFKHRSDALKFVRQIEGILEGMKY